MGRPAPSSPSSLSPLLVKVGSWVFGPKGPRLTGEREWSPPAPKQCHIVHVCVMASPAEGGDASTQARFISKGEGEGEFFGKKRGSFFLGRREGGEERRRVEGRVKGRVPGEGRWLGRGLLRGGGFQGGFWGGVRGEFRSGWWGS